MLVVRLPTDLGPDSLVCPLVEPVSVEQQPVLIVHVRPDPGHAGAVPGLCRESKHPGVRGDSGHQTWTSHQGVRVTVNQRGERLPASDLTS